MIIKNLIKRIFHKIMVYNLYRPKILKTDIIKLGNGLGVWHIPSGYLDSKSTVISVGGGENISFEIDLVEKFKSNVYIFDPTPRAKNYILDKIKNLDKIIFYDFGIADTNRTAKFYYPKDDNHVSLSLVNIQKTENYMEANFKTLNHIMKLVNLTKIDFLKLDIEGAEYQVIDYIIKQKIEIKILCIEFDEVFHQIDSEFRTRIKEYVHKLLNIGFIPVHVSLYQNYTFINNNYLKDKF